MSAEKQREIASKGGRAAHEKGTAHEWTADEARNAGRKGGQVSRGGRGRLVISPDAPPPAGIPDPALSGPLPAASGKCRRRTPRRKDARLWGRQKMEKSVDVAY